MTGIRLSGEELEALFALDVVSRHPDAGQDKSASKEVTTRQFPGAKPVVG